MWKQGYFYSNTRQFCSFELNRHTHFRVLFIFIDKSTVSFVIQYNTSLWKKVDRSFSNNLSFFLSLLIAGDSRTVWIMDRVKFIFLCCCCCSSSVCVLFFFLSVYSFVVQGERTMAKVFSSSNCIVNKRK